MANYRLHPIAGMVLGILLALILVGSFVGICIVCWKPWIWLFIPGLCGLTAFAAKPAYLLVKDLIEKGIERIKENKLKKDSSENPV